MITVTKAERTCSACPAQWDALTDDDREVYVRYRHGWLTVSVGDPGDHSEFAGVRGAEIVCENLGSSGFLSYNDLKEFTKDAIRWPKHDTGIIGKIYEPSL